MEDDLLLFHMQMIYDENFNKIISEKSITYLSSLADNGGGNAMNIFCFYYYLNSEYFYPKNYARVLSISKMFSSGLYFTDKKIFKQKKN
jgi:hypothetical protein